MKHPTIKQLYTTFIESGACLSTDSRTLQAGDFFVALSGEYYNGNQFAAQALQKGATYVVIDEENYYDSEQGNRCVLVPDTTATLAQLALYHRQQFTIPVIAIGGSNGKSTTKDLIRDVLATELNVCATPANDNNHIGVAQTLLRISPDHECVVLELGSNNPGEMRVLLQMSAPSHGLVTNIGKEHLGNFGGLEGVIAEECELYDVLKKSNGIVFAPDNDPVLTKCLEGVRYCRYGERSDSQYVVHKDPQSKRELVVIWQGIQIATHLVGNYNLQNIAAAIAVGSELGIQKEHIAHAIASYQPQSQRSQLVETSYNTVIYDCYNSNPSSLASALETFATLPSERKKVVIIGDMLELGIYAREEHAHALSLIDAYQFDAVYLVGPEFCAVADGRYPSFLNIDEIIQELQARPIRNSFVFIKASKGILWKYHRFDEFDL